MARRFRGGQDVKRREAGVRIAASSAAGRRRKIAHRAYLRAARISARITRRSGA